MEAIAIAAPWENYFPLTYELFVDIGIWKPNKRKRDTDNYPKVIFDGLEKSEIVVDDGLIKDHRIHELGVDRENPRIVITIYPLDQVEIIIREVA